MFGSGRRRRRGELVNERIGFGFYQSCGNKESVGRVFGLQWCGWVVGRMFGPGSGGVGWYYVCVNCEFGSGRRRRRGELVNERIGFGLYQSCGSKESVGRVFGLQWCGWGVGRMFGPGSGGVGWYYICVSCESGFFV